MSLTDELVASFEFINLSIKGNILKKCEELCESYSLDPEEFVNIWCAYAASTMCTDAPTIEMLEIMERKKLQKLNKEKSFPKTPTITPKKSKTEPQSVSIKANVSSLNDSNTETNMKLANDLQIQESFADLVPESQLLDVSLTTNQSSSTQEASKYKERTNSLSVKVSIGVEPKSSINEKNFTINIINGETFLSETKYMYEVMGQKASCMNSITNWIGNAIAKKNNVMISNDISTKNHIGSIVTYGKIFVDGNGHLNLQSIMLEGTVQLNSGHCVHLNVDKISKVELFPGQVVVVKGKMLSGNKLIAENIYTDAISDLPLEPPVVKDPLRIILASGPYTLNDNLNYDPMRDLLNYVNDNQPHILLLMGPFQDENHPVVTSGDMAETFDVFFDNLIESISVALQDMPIQIIIISSMRDVHHHNVYPTPPYRTREKHQNIKFLPDPCIFEIDGLVLGATTADIMYHIAKEELVTSKNSDTMSRLASHILQQNTFYPLYPPNLEMNISHVFMETFGMIECLPHLMIMPSTFKGFIRKINGSVVVNPERLAKGNSGGAFADIIISPGNSRSVTDRISCKILHI
ncbi:hypothetical protein WA026_017560 [Henosepilachna vigintioctopunctata]|uniref:DNA polymerase alpha subunit B n=1 Tax=Henosepilachna vigintioctopunctata TaxID=420089 RepID=A0AAW1UU05_9CUCU